LEKYEFVNSEQYPIEELWLAHNKLSNITLFTVSHNPCYVNLKILDLR